MSRERFTGFVSVLLAALLALLALGAGGAAAADVTLTNETVTVDGDTQSVYAEVNNSASADAPVSVKFTGLDADGNETWNETRAVTVSSDSTQMVERTDLNASAVDSVQVKVTLDNSSVSAENVSASTGSIQKVAGGSGGGFVDGSTGGVPNVAIGAGALVLALVYRSRD